MRPDACRRKERTHEYRISLAAQERYGIFIQNLEKTQIKDIIHTDKNPPVPITATTDELVERGMEQNFIPVVDDWGSFIGIITRRNLLERFAKYKD